MVRAVKYILLGKGRGGCRAEIEIISKDIPVRILPVPGNSGRVRDPRHSIRREGDAGSIRCMVDPDRGDDRIGFCLFRHTGEIDNTVVHDFRIIRGIAPDPYADVGIPAFMGSHLPDQPGDGPCPAIVGSRRTDLGIVKGAVNGTDSQGRIVKVFIQGIDEVDPKRNPFPDVFVFDPVVKHLAGKDMPFRAVLDIGVAGNDHSGLQAVAGLGILPKALVDQLFRSLRSKGTGRAAAAGAFLEIMQSHAVAEGP